MNKERIKYLLEQHLSDQLSPAEHNELISLNTIENEPVLLEVLQAMMNDSSITSEEVELFNKANFSGILSLDKTNINSSRNIPTKTRRLLPARSWLVAACVTLLLLSFGAYFWMSPQTSEKNKQAFVAADSRTPSDYVRTINLPDGTSIILQAGSTLDIHPNFSNTSREVTLQGEAYFEVKKINASQNKRSPFTIYSGKLKTVVLGTAFNIKAYPEQNNITVSVAEGKVRIEDGSKVLAVILPNQQLTYSNESSSVIQEEIDPEETEWTKYDMEFDGVRFEDIAQFLEKRYGVTIQFKNEKLKHCRIVSSFVGTESIENVLQTLCSIQNSTYTMKSDMDIVIDGNGCN
ncbi:FecR family protein [Dyadobacter sp. CY323]|uniref:FecR family protein n=1 Tax=Dyadobacter sp. CY323 TaxID=2907302 RepID=UPI001F26223D|nr:FecR family protein [Dyadobacter sp. CY323]MCE6989840.1 DUF4974 domain-containing protein [Dyadobacter sp. CY323]